MDPCWFHVCSYDTTFKPILALASSSPKYNIGVEINKISMLCFHISYTPRLRSKFCFYSRLIRFKMILQISNVFGSRDGASTIDDDTCAKMFYFSQIRKLNKSLFLLFMQINYYQWILVHLNSLDFPPNIHKICTKPVQLHILWFWSATGLFSSFGVLAL